MAFLTQPMNNFAQTPILGLVDEIPSPDVVAAQILPTSTATTIQVGDLVKLVDGTSGAILVDICTGPTDGPIFGVIPYNARKNKYLAGDIINVVCNLGYVYLKASAAIARGAKVSVTASTTTADPLLTTATVSTDYVLGRTVDTATAANQLVRVHITPSIPAQLAN